jgi:hypothetical protein
MLALLFPALALANYGDNYYDNNGYYRGNNSSDYNSNSYSSNQNNLNNTRINHQTYYMPELNDSDLFYYYNNYTQNHPNDRLSIQDFRRMQMILVRVEFKDISNNYIQNQPVYVKNNGQYPMVGLCGNADNNDNYNCNSGNGVLIFAIVLKINNVGCNNNDNNTTTATIRVGLTGSNDAYNDITPNFNSNSIDQSNNYNSAYDNYINSNSFDNYSYPYDRDDFKNYNELIWNARQNYKDNIYSQNSSNCSQNTSDNSYPTTSTSYSTSDNYTPTTETPPSAVSTDASKTKAFWIILLGYVLK